MEKHLRVLGIDIAKQIFHVVSMDGTGNIVLRKRLPRGALMPFIAQLSPVVIGEAVTRPTMRFVPVKELAQQDIQALHRVRERLVRARTALTNEMRGWLSA